MKTKILKRATLGFGILNLVVFIFHQHLPLNLFASLFCFFAYWQLSETEAMLKKAREWSLLSGIIEVYDRQFIENLKILDELKKK